MAEAGAWYAGQGQAALVGARLSMLIDADAHSDLVRALWPAIAAGELPAVVTVLAGQGMVALPGFVLVQGRPDGLLLLARGALAAAVYRGAELTETVRAGEVTTWFEVSIAGADRAVLRAASAVDGVVPPPPSRPLLPLLAGVVSATYLDWHRAVPAIPRAASAIGTSASAISGVASGGPGYSAPAGALEGSGGVVEGSAGMAAIDGPGGAGGVGAVTREWKEPVGVKPLPPGTMLDRLSFLDGVPDQAGERGRVGEYGQVGEHGQVGEAAVRQAHYGDTVSARPRNGVAAVRCPKLHLNPPATPVCRECLLPLDPGQEPFFVAQPVVGHLRRLNSSESWLLGKRVTLLGRSPGTAAAVPADDLQLVWLSEVSEAISELHAEVRLDGWRVEVIDRSDRGDTLITNPGDSPVRLEPGIPMRLMLGGQLRLGGEVSLVFGL